MCSFMIAYEKNFSSLFDHHVSVIIFCDKFEHDSFKFDKRQIKLCLMLVNDMIFSMCLNMMLVVLSNMFFHDNVRKEFLVSV